MPHTQVSILGGLGQPRIPTRQSFTDGEGMPDANSEVMAR